MRLAFVMLAGLILLGCADGTSERTMSVGEKNALNAAWQWVSAQGLDPASSEFSVDADGTNWSVLIEYQPPTPGAHTLLKIDSQGEVIDVIPGA